jgi:hypothetical protein
MTAIDLFWRTNHKGLPPRQIKLEIPGWSGHDTNHGDGATPQPWHCPPFVEGATYGLELLYPFDAECRVSIRNGALHFERDFSAEMHTSMRSVPFQEFAPHHYGFTSSLDLLVPDDMVIRVETHPRYFTDASGSSPCAVPGHIHTAFWPRIFFVVFKAPWPGQTHVFRKGEPYAQLLVLPRKARYEVQPMPEEEAHARELASGYIEECGDELARHKWTDDRGQRFDDKYKVLQAAFLKRGREGVDEALRKALRAAMPKRARKRDP